MKLVFALALLFGGASAGAHSTGHGAAIEGLGPGGGRFVAIIRAEDSEAGAAAKVQGVAEWRIVDGQLEVSLWNTDAKTPVQVGHGPNEKKLKWILLGKALEKPIVIATVLPKSTAKLSHAFDKLEQLDSVEAILPDFGSAKSKHVFIVPLK